MKTLLKITLTGALTAAAMQAGAGTIYECNGVYTDKPSRECRSGGQADLPSIGMYTSAKPRLNYEPVQARTAERAPSQPVRRAAAKLPVRQPSAQQVAYKPTAAPAANPAAQMPAPGAPKLTGSSGRRTILEQELNNERKALAQAQADLIRARAVKGGVVNAQQISDLQGHVLDRQQNIQALQRELGRM